MNKTYCTSCNESLSDDQVRWAYDDPYCQTCFDEGYTYCTQCDSVIGRSEAHVSSGGDYYCNDCWEEDYDDNSPDNPHITNADRTLIIELSRNWLLGKRTNRSLLKINKNDFILSNIRDKVGLVEHPIYLFGLIDREEYDISASSDLIDIVKEFILLNGYDWKVIEGIGCSRLGISYTLRQNHLPQIIKLIKQSAKLNVEETAV